MQKVMTHNLKVILDDNNHIAGRIRPQEYASRFDLVLDTCATYLAFLLERNTHIQ